MTDFVEALTKIYETSPDQLIYDKAVIECIIGMYEYSVYSEEFYSDNKKEDIEHLISLGCTVPGMAEYWLPKLLQE